MLVMTTPKKPRAQAAQGKTQPKRSGVALNVNIDEDIHAAFERYRAAQRVEPNKTKTVELALKEFLQREGFWPPKSDA